MNYTTLEEDKRIDEIFENPTENESFLLEIISRIDQQLFDEVHNQWELWIT